MIEPKVLIFIFFLFPFSICSQQVDSLNVVNINVNARELERSGNFQEAFSMINELISTLDGDENSKYLSLSLQTKSSIEKNLGRYTKSISTAQEALQICLKLKDTFNLAYNYNLIGIGYYFLSNYDSTKMYYEKSYALKIKINANEKVLAVSAYNLAMVYEDLAQPKKALELYLEAEKNLLKSGDKKSFLSDVYIGLAHIYFYQKDIDKATEYAEKAMDVGLISYGEYNPNMTFVYTSYANILENEGRYKESIKLLKKALKIRENTYGPYHDWTSESYYDLGNAYRLDEQLDKAEVHFKKAIVIGEKINSSKNLYYAKTFLANFFVDQNKNLQQAEELLKSVLKYNISVYGNKNELVAENYYYLAKISKIKNQESQFFDYINQSLNSCSYSSEDLGIIIAPFEALDAFILKENGLKKNMKSQKI